MGWGEERIPREDVRAGEKEGLEHQAGKNDLENRSRVRKPMGCIGGNWSLGWLGFKTLKANGER